LEFWRSVKDSNKVEELNAYLTSYPNGTFKSLALARIAAIKGASATTTRNAPAVADRPAVTKAARAKSDDSDDEPVRRRASSGGSRRSYSG
ncbi:hypothetical protein ACJELQ_26560, partial [Escherichia coli]